MYLLQNMHRINTQKQIHRKVSLNCDVWLLSVGIIFVKSGIFKCRLNLMNGCSWEILHFITIYFIPAEEGVAQHSTVGDINTNQTWFHIPTHLDAR